MPKAMNKTFICERCGEISRLYVGGMKICRECRSEIVKKSKVCAVCGKPLTPLAPELVYKVFTTGEKRKCQSCALKGRKWAKPEETDIPKTVKTKKPRPASQPGGDILPDLEACAEIQNKYGVSYGQLRSRAENYNSLDELIADLEKEQCKIKPAASAKSAAWWNTWPNT